MLFNLGTRYPLAVVIPARAGIQAFPGNVLDSRGAELTDPQLFEKANFDKNDNFEEMREAGNE